MMPRDDQYFLLYFIMGTYFGPDIKGDKTQKSALQRIAEGLPPYTQEQLSGSQMRTSEMEKIYFYLLRKADKSLAVEIPVFHNFVQVDGLCTEDRNETRDYPKFSTLFPQDLHPQMESLDNSRFIANVVFIQNPAIFYIKQEDVDRFKRLTKLEDLFIENQTASLPNSSALAKISDDVEVDEEVPIMQYFRRRQKQRKLNEILGVGNPQLQKTNGATTPNLPYEFTMQAIQQCMKKARSEVVEGPGVVIIPTRPSRDELDHILEVARNAYAVTGSAAKGKMGSAIGLMDVGESKDSYLFRVALPGVKRENRSFQCEVESDGKVVIRGETVTGEKNVNRYSQDFEMQTHNLCPSGPFSVLFHLPGPVDPQRFIGSFGTDGILEGIVMKPTQHSSRPTRL